MDDTTQNEQITPKTTSTPASQNATHGKGKEITQYALTLFLFVGIVYMSTQLFVPTQAQTAQTHSTSTPPTVAELFRDVDVEAESFIVYSPKEKKVIAGKNAETQRPLASISKVMTAVVATEYLGENSIITISADDLNIEGDSGLFLLESWTFKELRDYTLVVSSNDGANAIARAVETLLGDGVLFIDLMNQKAVELGLAQTYFLNESGLDIDEETQSGSYGSAHDIAKLVAYGIERYPFIFEATRKNTIYTQSLNGFEHIGENTNERVDKMLGVLGSKTGFTDLAGGNLVVAFDIGLNEPYIIVVLGSSQEGRIDDVETLYHTLLEGIHNSRKVLDSTEG